MISLKGNQGILHQEIKDYLDWAERIGFREISYDYCATLEKDHSRIETRRCFGDGRNRLVRGKRGVEEPAKCDPGGSRKRSDRRAENS